MQLIYRGYTYTIESIIPIQPVKPQAINWRYRIAGTADEPQSYGPHFVAPSYIPPRALNWRYQLSTNA
ncbi:MAG TPA: hypothetical protein V6C65_28735 [Allocoleopsis sp.]